MMTSVTGTSGSRMKLKNTGVKETMAKSSQTQQAPNWLSFSLFDLFSV